MLCMILHSFRHLIKHQSFVLRAVAIQHNEDGKEHKTKFAPNFDFSKWTKDMMDRTVRMSQLWGECRYCPKFPEKNVQNSKKMYKNKKKMCKNKKNVQYSDDPGITSGHMLEVLA